MVNGEWFFLFRVTSWIVLSCDLVERIGPQREVDPRNYTKEKQGNERGAI